MKDLKWFFQQIRILILLFNVRIRVGWINYIQITIFRRMRKRIFFKLLSTKVLYRRRYINCHKCEDCTSIVKVMATNKIQRICWFVFSVYMELNNIVIPESVTEICDYDFCGCASLANAIIRDGVTKIDFDSCSFSNFRIPKSINEIGSYVFLIIFCFFKNNNTK